MNDSEYEHNLGLRLETMAAEPAFDELLELGVEVFFVDPERYPRNLEAIRCSRDEAVEASSEAKVLADVGLWGLRSVMEVRSNAKLVHPLTKAEGSAEESDDDKKIDPSLFSMLQRPEVLSLPVDRSIQDKVEAFGKTVLDEAFHCLGRDAAEKAEAYGQAPVEEQLETLRWLLTRVVAIRDKFKPEKSADEVIELDEGPTEAWTGFNTEHFVVREPIDEGPVRVADRPREIVIVDTSEEPPRREYFYHPARLSPRLLGQYPDTTLEPTCLGVSILVASFFERAGVPYLHAGVATTALEESQFNIFGIASIAQDMAEAVGITLPDHIQARLEESKKPRLEAAEVDNGTHAAVLTRLADGHWRLIDPNYKTNVPYSLSEDQEIIEEWYQAAADVHDVLSGVESTLYSNEGMCSVAFMDAAVAIEQRDISAVELGTVLADASLSDRPDDVLKAYLLGFIADHEVLNHSMDVYVERTGQNKVAYTDKLLDKVLSKYVFADVKDGDYTKSLERCKTDSQYLHRRLEDLRMAPHYVVHRMAADFERGVILGGDGIINLPHKTVEAGLPHYRVGACVLSDLAVYCGDELPISFWTTYWPSHVVFADHAPDYRPDDPQVEHARRLAQVMAEAHELLYFGKDFIITEFLEQGMEDSPDGTQQG